MKRIVKYEFKKIWTKLTIISVISLIVVSTILNLIAFFNSEVAITSDGYEIRGMKSFRAIKKQSQDIKGEINQEYLDNLVKEFNSSVEKNEFSEMMKYELTKYKFPNLTINFANYGPKMMSDKKNLDFKFLESEEDFYNQYKKSMSETIKVENQQNWFRYTNEQMNEINKKIDDIDIPFKVDYYQGLEYFMWQYGAQYIFVLIVIAFALSSFFSKDSNNGIDELSLSSKFGRKMNMNARIIAGNIFAVVIYTMFTLNLLIQIGAVASLSGWNQSIQNMLYTCLYNISIGDGILIMITQGLLVMLIITNLVMFISVKFKYSKLATILSLASIWLIDRLTYTTDTLSLQLNPLYYVTSTISSSTYYFIGDIMIPYVLAFVGIGAMYLIIIRILTIREYKKYKLN
ncbi:MAG: hypothetical protein ACRCX2_07005 [Paraclostridium sp.]